MKFAVFKTIKILTETGANLVLFFVFPARPDFTYPIFAIFVSCVLCLLLFIPDIVRLRLVWDGPLVRRMLLYSLPLMVAALPGVANDFLDRVLFRFFDTSSAQWQATLGVYQAAVKLAVMRLSDGRASGLFHPGRWSSLLRPGLQYPGRGQCGRQCPLRPAKPHAGVPD